MDQISPFLPGQPRTALASRPVFGRSSRDPLLDEIWSGYARMPGWESGTLVHYWGMISRRKGTVLLITLLCTLIAYLITKAQPRIYQAKTLLEIESLNEDFLNIRNVSPTAPDQNTQSPEYNIRTQITVLQSRPVLERAMQKIGIEKRLLLSRKVGGFFPWQKSKSDQERTSASLHAKAVALASAALRIRPQPNTRVLEVTFDSTDPQLAADFVNSLTLAFNEVSLENRWQATQSTSAWLSRQLQDVKLKLERSQDALQNYARAASLTFMSETDTRADTTVEERLRQLQTELSKAEADRVEKQSRYELASTAPVDSLPEVLDNQTLKDYQIQLTGLRRQLAEMSSSFTPAYPKMTSLRAQIAALQTALERERANVVSRTHNEYQAARRRETLVNRTYDSVIGLMSKQTEKVNHYIVLKREFETTRQLYESLVQKVKEADLASAMRASDVHVIESAIAPHNPYKPIGWLNLVFGLITGLCMSVAFIVQRARSYHGIQGPGDTVFELNVPELGVIPAGKPSFHFRRLLGKVDSTDDSGRPELTIWQRSPSAVAESFRLALTSILLSSNAGVRPRVIAFSSANAGEGKTTIVCNLAIALARINRRVLLIDGDLRKRRLHHIFEVDNSVGLKDVLAGNAAVSVRETKIPNLFLLPSGKGPGEMLFFTPQLTDLFQRVKTEFDMVLIDTPPLLQISDARHLCHHADAVVLVVGQHTAREAILVAHHRLAEDGSHVIGTILNKWDPKTSPYGYQDYYADYYGDYAKENAT